MIFDEKDVELRTSVDERRYGGQHVTKTDTSVLAIHGPSGIAFISRTERSQHGNRLRAIERLRGLVLLVDVVA